MILVYTSGEKDIKTLWGQCYCSQSLATMDTLATVYIVNLKKQLITNNANQIELLGTPCNHYIHPDALISQLKQDGLCNLFQKQQIMWIMLFFYPNYIKPSWLELKIVVHVPEVTIYNVNVAYFKNLTDFVTQ